MAASSNIAVTIPGPRAALLGWRGQTLAFLRDPVTFMSTLYREYGQVTAWLRGNPGWMFGFGPEYNQQVLCDSARFLAVPIAPLGTPPNTPLARLTHNLLSMSGETHRQQRRLMLPAFHRKRVDRRVTITMSPRHGMPMIVAPRDQRITIGHVRGNIREMVDFE